MANSRMVGGIRIPLTSQEQTDHDAAAVEANVEKVANADPDVIAEKAIAATFEGDKIRRLIFEIEFDQENRIRVLEGKASTTKAVYRDALLTRLKALV